VQGDSQRVSSKENYQLVKARCKDNGCLIGAERFTHYQAPIFISRVFTPGCAVVDAFRQNWAEVVQDNTAWASPPSRAVSQTLSLIERYSISTLVIMPGGSASNESIQLRQIAEASISGPFTISREVSSVRPTSRVPVGTLNPALLGLAVYRISWP
jgi:hypothetical protein